jgi:dTMP kinase
MPDCTLLLDVPVRVGLERMQARRGAVDRFEVESAQFFDRVRTRYLELARASAARFRIVDATQAVEQVSEAAIAALDSALGLPQA